MLSTKAFPNLISKSKYAMLMPRDPCSLKGCRKDPWETL